MPRLDRPIADDGRECWRTVTLVGTAERIELRFLSRGTAVLNLHLRTDHGAQVEVEVFGLQATNGAMSLETGERVIACGRLYGRRRITLRAFEIALAVRGSDVHRS